MTIDSAAVSSHPVPATPGPCRHFDPQLLDQELAAALGALGLQQSLRDSHPHLFSASLVFVRPADLDRMRAVIEAAESVIALPAYRAHVLATAGESARHDPRTPGASLGYDFHFGPDGPRLIEINTNAGGALLALALTRAHLACCAPLRDRAPAPEAVEASFTAMFLAEWRAARGDRPLQTVAIVDSDPARQFLYPEFVLYRELFRRQGIEALIADPSELALQGGNLQIAGRNIDLVYNRLTDFALTEPAHTVLRRAYLEDLAVITPHPRAHALYADKRNLEALTDTRLLREFGVPEPTLDILRHGVAHTRAVDRAGADRYWAQRKQLFFKPAGGYGSKAVYRGDKLTKRVWEEILAGNYVAQTLVPPAEQSVGHAAEETILKYDVRNFVYGGQIQLLAARLYRGQTTNFRTPGGGFAPVFRVAGDGP